MKNDKATYNTIGLMSGTSLDGLDIAHVILTYENNKWKYDFGKCTTVPYSKKWEEKLKDCMTLSTKSLQVLSLELGKLWGEEVAIFIKKNNLSLDFISSHGHTVFHQPENGITMQIGDAYEIAKACGITTISDFRTKDVKLGGQGAPLVPIGDKLLFNDYEYCLNLGGISNISFDDESGNRRAFDISPCNLVLNHYANSIGLEFDQDGQLGRKGKLNSTLFDELNKVEYYAKDSPKSLGKEDIINDFIPLIDSFEISLEDKMRTFYEHITFQISKVLTSGRCLITGGGAYNTFLIELLREKSISEVYLPNSKLISFKEALVFSFLGALRIRNETNILKSYTGAKEDSCSGVVNKFKT